MKKFAFILALLAATSPAPRAQNAPPALASIDSTARDLLARTQARYQGFRSFESRIEWKIGAAGRGLPPRRFRVQMTRDGQFVVGEEFPDKSWRKAICDGTTLVEFRSKFPKTYTRTSVKSPLYLSRQTQLEAALRSVDAEGPLLSLMLTDDFASALLSPDLQRVALLPDAARPTVVIDLHAPPSSPTPDAFYRQAFALRPSDLTLEEVSLSDENGLVFTESYSQTRFDPPFETALFRAAAPLNYRLVSSFPDEVASVATPPRVSVP